MSGTPGSQAASEGEVGRLSGESTIRVMPAPRLVVGHALAQQLQILPAAARTENADKRLWGKVQDTGGTDRR